VSQYFWPESFRVTDLAHALAERGVEVKVLTGQPNYPEGKVFDGYSAWKAGTTKVGALTVGRVPLMPRGRGGALRLIANYLSFVASASLIGPFVSRDRADVIFVYGISPILQAIP